MQWAYAIVGEARAREVRPARSAHEANAQEARAVGLSRETQPTRQNL